MSRRHWDVEFFLLLAIGILTGAALSGYVVMWMLHTGRLVSP